MQNKARQQRIIKSCTFYLKGLWGYIWRKKNLSYLLIRRRYSLYRVITWPWSSICKHTWRKNGVNLCFSSLEGQSDLTSRKLWKLAENSLIFLLFCQKNENFSPKVPIMTFWCGRKKWRGRRTVNTSFNCGGLIRSGHSPTDTKCVAL